MKYLNCIFCLFCFVCVCVCLDAVAAHYIRTTTLWNGDTWRALVALRLRSDLDIVTVDVDQGIGAIRRVPPSAAHISRHVPLSDEWKALLGKYPIHNLEYSLLESNRVELLNMMTRTEFLQWLTAYDNNI